MSSSLFALLDDIASILDDVAAMTKVAAKKTAGVLGDDLALNAEQVTGVRPDRELPVVWAVAKGSLLNKVILVPLALAIGALAGWAIMPLLMLGGAFLCYEGVEKVAHKLFADPTDHLGADARQTDMRVNPSRQDAAALEKVKIRGAIRTDFILSAEIVVITLGSVADASFANRVLVLSTIAVLMTAGVYGLVGGIVKLDDLGLLLAGKGNALARRVGYGVLRGAPALMKTISVAGTVAMFLVGGGIIAHGLTPLHHGTERLGQLASGVPVVGPTLASILPTLIHAAIGVLLGIAALAVVTLSKKVWALYRRRRRVD